jgi:hypothetical protein
MFFGREGDLSGGAACIKGLTGSIFQKMHQQDRGFAMHTLLRVLLLLVLLLVSPAAIAAPPDQVDPSLASPPTEPMIPPAKHGGRGREVNVREVLNAICYVLSTGCRWQALPKDLPPKSTAHS